MSTAFYLENSFQIVVPSNDPTVSPVSNTNFTVSLPYPVPLPGKWYVSLLIANWEPAVQDTIYYVYCDFIYPTITGSFSVNLLGILNGQPAAGLSYVQQSPDPQLWKLVSTQNLTQISVTIRDGLGNIPAFNTPTVLTLLFNRIE